MSFIDTFNHKEIGIFLGRPFYITEENIFSEYNERVSLKSKILFGGGSGESPMVLVNVEDAVKSYLNVMQQELLKLSDSALFYDNWTSKEMDSLEEDTKTANFPILKKESIDEYILVNFGEFIFCCMPELLKNKPQHPSNYNKIDTVRERLRNNIFIQAPNNPWSFGRKEVDGKLIMKSSYWFD